MLAAIVHNAMAQKACLRALPLFRALAAAMRASAYSPLLTHPPAEASPKAEARRALTLTGACGHTRRCVCRTLRPGV